jgi:hypothetical protein
MWPSFYLSRMSGNWSLPLVTTDWRHQPKAAASSLTNVGNSQEVDLLLPAICFLVRPITPPRAQTIARTAGEKQECLDFRICLPLGGQLLPLRLDGVNQIAVTALVPYLTQAQVMQPQPASCPYHPAFASNFSARPP